MIALPLVGRQIDSFSVYIFSTYLRRLDNITVALLRGQRYKHERRKPVVD